MNLSAVQTRLPRPLAAVFLFATLLPALAADNPSPPQTSPIIPYLTAEQEAKTFDLKPGYSLQLVVGDPIIKEPVLAVFDGNGRMYVAEMRSYMQNIDGTNQLIPASRISLHWSSKGDGNFDRHTVFADQLVLPRMILPLADSVLVTETGSDNIWRYRDTHGDGVADEKKLFIKGAPRGENLEHQPSGLIWDMDNWVYETVNPVRLRLRGTNVLVEQTPPNYGQWGLTQDDYGKTYFMNAMFEAGPVSYETPIAYGASELDGKYTPKFQEVFPLVGTADYQGGLDRVRPADKTLNHITGACGPDIFRGDRLPADLRGDLLFGEPVGRLVRRAKVNVQEGFTILSNPYESQRSEFIRSTDPNFRPVNCVTAPDGTLYIVDMYRGIIQESAWVDKGSYLRQVVQKLQLDKNFGRGRIWRLVHQDFSPGPQPHMLDESPAQLVAHLDHPNGWWRDNAQKLLVLRADKSVVPALVNLARTDTNALARIHALWTLEGLDALDPALVRAKLADPDPQVRVAAIRASETLYHAGDHSLVADILDHAHDPDPAVVVQTLLTANYLRLPQAPALIASTVGANPALGVQKIGAALLKLTGAPVLPPEFTAEDRALLAQGQLIYQQLCFACHGLDGRGMPLTSGPPGSTMAPSLQGNPIVTGYRDGAINVLLKGLNGPVDGHTYTAVMSPEQFNNDQWIASVLSYVRAGFGNSASLVRTNDVAAVRASFASRAVPWATPELLATLPPPLTDRLQWKLTASDDSAAAPLAVDADPASSYRTRAAQTPGLWFQVQLPQLETIAGLELNTGASRDEFPRGYQVQLSSDGRRWDPPLATGHGTGAQTEIVFPPAPAKFIRLTLTTADPHNWSLHDLQLLSPAPPPPKSGPVTKPLPSKYD